jgi:hypothetical protein
MAQKKSITFMSKRPQNWGGIESPIQLLIVLSNGGFCEKLPTVLAED